MKPLRVLIVLGRADRVSRGVGVLGPRERVARASSIARLRGKAADTKGRELRATGTPNIDCVADGRAVPFAIWIKCDFAGRPLEADVGEGLEDCSTTRVLSRGMHCSRECDRAVIGEGCVNKRLGAEDVSLTHVEHVVRAVRVGRGRPRVSEAIIPLLAGGGGIEL